MRSLSLAKFPLILLLLFALPHALAQELNPEERHDPEPHRGQGPGLAVQLPEDSVTTAHGHTRRAAALLQSHRRRLADVRPKGELAAKVFCTCPTPVEGAGVRPINLRLQRRPGCWRRFS